MPEYEVKCCLCGKSYRVHKNDFEPVIKGEKFACCSECNTTIVTPALLKALDK